MVSIVNNTITLVRGDTVEIPVTIRTREGDVYEPSEGDVYANWCLFQKCVLWRNTTSDFLDYYVWNQNKSATAKVKIRVWILYVKTGLI